MLTFRTLDLIRRDVAAARWLATDDRMIEALDRAVTALDVELDAIAKQELDSVHFAQEWTERFGGLCIHHTRKT